jgi:hypothetical protein
MHYCFGHLPLPDHSHWQPLCGSHSTKNNMDYLLRVRIHHLTTPRCQLPLPLFPLLWYRRCFRAAFDRCNICICRDQTRQYLMVQPSSPRRAYAPHLTVRLRRTYLNATLGLNFTTTITPSSDLSLHLNSLHALGSLIHCGIDFPNPEIGLR